MCKTCEIGWIIELVSVDLSNIKTGIALGWPAVENCSDAAA
jgi:hypothetical protein